MAVLSKSLSAELPWPTARTLSRPKAAQGFNVHVQGARGLLALMVFIFHVASSGLPSFAALGGQGSAIPALLCLQYGVEIFFCISGTIVVGALQRARSPGQFIAERALRIFPVLWVTLAVIVPLGLATHQGPYSSWSAADLAWIIPANLIVLPGVFSLPVLHMAAWSLSYEMVFYVAAMAIWWIAPRQPWVRRIVLCGVFAAVAWEPRAIFFAIGVLVARTDFSQHHVLSRLIRFPLLWLVAFFALWHFTVSGGADGSAGSLRMWLADGRIGFCALGVSAAILCWAGIVGGHGLTCRILRTAPAQWLAAISYSFYLWHLIVLAVLKRLIMASGITAAHSEWSQVILMVTALPVSLIVAQLSVTLIERRFTRWFKTLAFHPRRPVLTQRIA